MTGQNRKRVLSDEPVGFFPWLRNQLYTFVAQEGDFALQFVGDLIRGPDPIRETRHLKRQVKYQESRGQRGPLKTASQGTDHPEKPLTKTESATFVELLRRKPSEPQLIYWKRKKALLNTSNKRDLISQHVALQKHMAARKIQTPTPETGFIGQYRDAARKKRSTQKIRKR